MVTDPKHFCSNSPESSTVFLSDDFRTCASVDCCADGLVILQLEALIDGISGNKTQSRKKKTASKSQLAETSFELKIPHLWVWELWRKSANVDLQIRNPSCRPRGDFFFHPHSVLGQLCCCSFCLHLELNSAHSPKHLSWVTVWKWSYCLLLCPAERLIDRGAIC